MKTQTRDRIVVESEKVGRPAREGGEGERAAPRERYALTGG